MAQSVPPTGGPIGYESRYEARSASTTSPLLVLLAWLVVGVPAAWGIEQTVKKSLALFSNPPAPTPVVAPIRPPVAAPATSPATRQASEGR